MAAPIRRRVLITVLTGSLLVVLLAGFGAAVQIGLSPAALPGVRSSRFVAADGTRGFANFSEAGQSASAMVENALLTGSQIVSTAPGAMWEAMAPSPEPDRTRAQWWREAVVVSGVDEQPTSRYRIRSITDQGVRLHGQAWGRLGITFEPALLELPPDPVAGGRWTSTGQALAAPNDQLLSYRTTSSASRPSSATGADADDGCLQVDSSTELQPVGQAASTGSASRWTESELWCPGEGVVADRGDFRGTAFTLDRTSVTVPNTLSVDALAPAVPSGGMLDSWQQGRLVADDGDPTFGAHPTVIDTDGAQATTDASGSLHVLNSTERDVNSLTPLSNGRFWANTWLHPGAQVTTVASLGGLVLLTTADRRLMAYDFEGRLRWSTQLPEVAVVAPLPVPGNRLLVATLGGQVDSYDARTGARIWRHELGTAVVAGLAAGGGAALVVDNQKELHALDLADGHELWNADVPTEKTEVAVSGQTVLTHTYAHLIAFSLQTGRVSWERTGLGDTDALRVFGDTAVLLSAGQVRGYAAADGTLRWTTAATGSGAVLDAQRYGEHDFFLTAEAILAVDDNGRTQHRWPLGVDLGRHARLLTRAGQLWAVGADAQGLTGTWIGDREPGQ